jgi:hypothetical protein
VSANRGSVGHARCGWPANLLKHSVLEVNVFLTQLPKYNFIVISIASSFLRDIMIEIDRLF